MNLTTEKYDVEVLKTKTLQFLELLLVSFESKEITPYLHILVAHLHEFKALHGSVNNFNQQGLEKLNDRTTMEYFRATNKNKRGRRRAYENDDEADVIEDNFDKIWLIQMLELRNRNEEATLRQDILMEDDDLITRHNIMNEDDEAILKHHFQTESDEEDDEY